MKPSERIDKIHTELLSRYSVRPDDTDWVYEKFKAISTFLDEQAESQEPKALEYLKNPVPVKYIDGEIPRKV